MPRAGMNSGRAIEPEWSTDVLYFWFAELGEAHWFARSDATDALVRKRFLGLHEQLAADEPGGGATPHWALATVIVLDQFPRNMFRGTPRAFATDALARKAARSAIDAGLDAHLTRAHQSIIERFGRFPHRNAILGRKSSAEELVSLADPKGSF